MTDASTRTWNDLLLEDRIAYGAAAHGNRGQYSGRKVHRLVTAYVVGLNSVLVSPRPGTVGANFLRTGKPQLFSAHPACGVTGGQHAGRPLANLTASDVTCTRCAAIEHRLQVVAELRAAELAR